MNAGRPNRSLQFIPYTDKILVHSENFVNIEGQKPTEYSVINGKDVVFDKKDLKSDNWLLCVDNKKEVIFGKTEMELAQEQIRKLISMKICLCIQNIMPKHVKDYVAEMYKKRISVKNIKVENIQRKYLDLEDYLKHNITPSQIIVDNYRCGDKIWHYNSFPVKEESLLGCAIESIILVREEEVVCSPIIRFCIREMFA